MHAGMGLSSKTHPYKWKGGNAARCACCVKFAPAGSAGWVEIHVEGEAASYRSGQSLLAIGKVTAQMAEVIAACNNLVPSQVPLAHRSCARAAAAAFAVGKRLRGQEPASQLQPMPRLSSTPTQAPAQPGPAHAPCPHHLPDQPPSHPSQLQGSSQHHPALPALLHSPGLSILTRPATNPVTSRAVEQQPIIHTTEEQDEQTMPPSMPKQQQDWATARVQLLMDSGTCGKKGGQHTDDVTARRVLARLVPPELLEQQLVSAFAQQTGLDRHWVSEAARQNLDQHACIEDWVDSLRHFAAVRSPDNSGHQGISQAVFDFIRHHYHERSKPSPSCKDQRSYWVCLTTGPTITKPFVAMPMFDQKRDDKHWDDECLTLLCSFAPDSVKQLCTLGKKLSVKMLNEYCKAVGLYVPANTLRADLRYMVLEHLNGQAEWD
ncbi:hypothetical protein QJQ45_007833 [Haematococcus lacustris]|nr:hypothetical protein QJQ45_007833 [Haematococcus lacustris]